MPNFTKTCPTCQKKFTRYLKPSAATRNGEPRFCSRACCQRIPRDAALLKRLYWKDGLSTVEIAKRFRVTFASVAKAMEELGVPRRSAADAALKVMAERTPEERSRNTKASHDAIRGKRRSHQFLRNRAAGVQRAGRLSAHEAEVLRLLKHHGLHPIPQFAVDKYNIDIAFPDRMIGFEITSGGWHRTLRKKAADARKSRALRKLGWTIVDLNNQRTPPKKAATQIIAFMCGEQVPRTAIR